MDAFLKTVVCVVILSTGTSGCQINKTYPHQGDCNMFLRCEPPGTIVFLTCPRGEHFNRVTGKCDTPEKANCSLPETSEVSTVGKGKPVEEKPTELKEIDVVDLIEYNLNADNNTDGILPGEEIVHEEYDNDTQTKNEAIKGAGRVKSVDREYDSSHIDLNATGVEPLAIINDFIGDHNSSVVNFDNLTVVKSDVPESKDYVHESLEGSISDTIIADLPYHDVKGHQQNQSTEVKTEYQMNTTSLDNIPGLRNVTTEGDKRQKTKDIETPTKAKEKKQ